MNKSQAIRLKCLDCCCNSPKEVTICHLVDCPLWQYRFGYSIRDKRYKKRMEAAKRSYPKEYQRMLEMIRERMEKPPNSPEDVKINAVLKKTVEAMEISIIHRKRRKI